tara:strand:+ start:270 stop:635 length:366 start_codon:yes stop_codon:yes gene_type:complete
MKSIGRKEIQMLNEQMLVAGQEIAAKHGLIAKPDGGRYSGASGTCKILFEMPEQVAMIADRDAVLLGAKFNVGHLFKSNGREFKVSGFSLRRRRYPVSAIEVSSGREYKFTVSAVPCKGTK